MRQLMFITLVLIGFSATAQNRASIDSFKTVIRNAPNDTVKADNLLLLGEEYYMNYVDSATMVWEQAMRVSEEIGYDLGMADSYNNLGYIFEYMGNMPKSLEYYLKTIPIDEKLGNFEGMSVTLGNIGQSYVAMGDYKTARDYYDRSLAILKEHENPRQLARTYTHIGYLNSLNQDYDSAMYYYRKGLSISIDISSPEEANAYNNIAKIHHRYGNIDSSYYYQEKCLQLAQKDHNWGIAIYSYCNLGILEKEKGNYEDAKIYYEQALAIVNEMKVMYELPKCLTLLSEVNELMGNYEEALDQYKKFTALNDSIFNESKSKEIGKLEAGYEFEKKLEEEKRAEEERLKIVQEAKSRKDNIQYSGILVFVLLLFAVVFMSGKFSMSEKVAEGLIFFTFLLFFEFCLVLLDPYIESLSGGEPLFKLLLNALLAAAIFPAHAFFEENLKRRLIKK